LANIKALLGVAELTAQPCPTAAATHNRTELLLIPCNTRPLALLHVLSCHCSSWGIGSKSGTSIIKAAVAADAFPFLQHRLVAPDTHQLLAATTHRFCCSLLLLLTKQLHLLPCYTLLQLL
jgi:hypothetical protein